MYIYIWYIYIYTYDIYIYIYTYVYIYTYICNPPMYLISRALKITVEVTLGVRPGIGPGFAEAFDQSFRSLEDLLEARRSSSGILAGTGRYWKILDGEAIFWKSTGWHSEKNCRYTDILMYCDILWYACDMQWYAFDAESSMIKSYNVYDMISSILSSAITRK